MILLFHDIRVYVPPTRVHNLGQNSQKPKYKKITHLPLPKIKFGYPQHLRHITVVISDFPALEKKLTKFSIHRHSYPRSLEIFPPSTRETVFYNRSFHFVGTEKINFVSHGTLESHFIFMAKWVSPLNKPAMKQSIPMFCRLNRVT